MKKWIIAGVVLAAGAALALPFSIITAVTAMFGGAQEQVSAQSAALCSASWQGEGISERDLNQEQLDAAATIYAAALEAGVGPEGATIGIATALQESDLGAASSSLRPNGDGDIGLFQQRVFVGWYADGATEEDNVKTLLDHAYQARNFFLGHDSIKGYHIPGLVDISDWKTRSLTSAAQEVQVSAFPDAYAKHEPLARSLVNRLSGATPGQIICAGVVGGSLDCAPSGFGDEAGLNPDALRGMRCVKQTWPQIKTIGGRRVDPGSDHHDGNAIDVMIPAYTTAEGVDLGTEIAEWAKANAEGLGVTYVIWRKQLWSVGRASEGWRTCGVGASCYSGSDVSASHMDHVHISFIGSGGTGVPAGTDSASSGGGQPAAGSVALPVAKGSYRISARYNQAGSMWSSGFHTGLDFAAPNGTPIVSITDGIVLETPWHNSYGNLTVVQAADGTKFYYAHQTSRAVTKGQAVKTGQVIGTVGETGNVSGPHLHLEVRVAGSRVDPDTWLRRRGVTP